MFIETIRVGAASTVTVGGMRAVAVPAEARAGRRLLCTASAPACVDVVMVTVIRTEPAETLTSTSFVLTPAAAAKLDAI